MGRAEGVVSGQDGGSGGVDGEGLGLHSDTRGQRVHATKVSYWLTVVRGWGRFEPGRGHGIGWDWGVMLLMVLKSASEGVLLVSVVGYCVRRGGVVFYAAAIRRVLVSCLWVRRLL